MPQIRDVLNDRPIYSIDAEGSVLEACRYMMEHNIGALAVMRDGALVGMFSERDVMNRVVAAGRNPGTTVISEVMSPNPKSVNADETVEDCLFLMREFGFRHLPITDGGKLLGVVSMRDILLRHTAEQERQARKKAS